MLRSSEPESEQRSCADKGVPKYNLGTRNASALTLFFLSTFGVAHLAAHEGSPNAEVDITLIDYFKDEPIEIYSSGKKIFSSSVTTDGVTGIAASLDITGPAVIVVHLPRLKLARSYSIDPRRGKFIYVSLVGAKLGFEQRPTPFAFD